MPILFGRSWQLSQSLCECRSQVPQNVMGVVAHECIKTSASDLMEILEYLLQMQNEEISDFLGIDIGLMDSVGLKEGGLEGPRKSSPN